VVTFKLTLPQDLSTDPVIAVEEIGDLPEYGQVWVWDMLLAQMLFELGGDVAAEELKEILDLWAVNMSSKIHQPYEHIRSKGHTVIHKELSVGEVAHPGQQITMEVTGSAQEMPTVTVHYPDSLSAREKAMAVIALAQYFIDRNELFAKELPIHVLAFRKYYSDVRTHTEAESVEEAPLFAIQKALEYYNSVAGGTMQ
jgi:hypothetical protein